MKVTTKLLKATLIKTYGHVLPAIRVLKKDYGIDTSRNSVYKRIRNNPSLKEAVNEALENLKDIAEHELSRNITKGNMTAIMFFLKTKAKDRGYVEKVEQAHSGELKLEQTESFDFSHWSDEDVDAYIALLEKIEFKHQKNE